MTETVLSPWSSVSGEGKSYELEDQEMGKNRRGSSVVRWASCSQVGLPAGPNEFWWTAAFVNRPAKLGRGMCAQKCRLPKPLPNSVHCG